jgi:hypothetical protein
VDTDEEDGGSGHVVSVGDVLVGGG